LFVSVEYLADNITHVTLCFIVFFHLFYLIFHSFHDRSQTAFEYSIYGIIPSEYNYGINSELQPEAEPPKPLTTAPLHLQEGK
jgi:hypothetical protein